MQNIAKAIDLIKSTKIYGLPILDLIREISGSLNYSAEPSDLLKFDPELTKALKENIFIRFDQDSMKFYFKFSGQYLNLEEFEKDLNEKKKLIITDLGISYEGLIDDIKVNF